MTLEAEMKALSDQLTGGCAVNLIERQGRRPLWLLNDEDIDYVRSAIEAKIREPRS